MIEVPDSEDSSVLTDWVEASCLFGDGDSLSHSEVRLNLESEGIKEPTIHIEGIWRTINSRSSRLRTSPYPLSTEGTRFVRRKNWTQTLAYSFQLLLACKSYYRSIRSRSRSSDSLAKQFELLSEVASRQYLSSLSLNTGFPRKPPVPCGFKQCLKYLCRRLNEEPGRLEPFRRLAKDDGLDVVTWVPFEDRLPGQVVLLIQCATGANWELKPTELCVETWRDYISWHVPPARAFAIPFVCSDSSDLWREMSKKGGIIFDRLRISSLFESLPLQPREIARLRSQLQASCENLIPHLPWVE